MGLTVSVFTPTPQFANDLADVVRIFGATPPFW